MESIEEGGIQFFKGSEIEKDSELQPMAENNLLRTENLHFHSESGSDQSSDYSEAASSCGEGDDSDHECKDPNLEAKGEIPTDLSASKHANSSVSYEDDSFSKETESPSAERGRPSACVFVASLSSNLSDDILCQSVNTHFKQWGVISLVKVLRDPANRPYAFVQYTKEEDAKRAIAEGQHSLLNGRTIRCEKARVNRTLYVETTNKALVESSIRSFLEKYGEIEKLVSVDEKSNLVDIHSGAHSYWFCKFVYRQDAISAYANLKVKPFWNVEWAQNLEDEGNDTPEVTIDKYSIFVGQLDPRINREELIERFEQHGKIKEAILVNRPLNNFAFVKFETRKAAASAVERENHSMFKFKTIHVQYREMYNNYKNKFSTENGPKLNLAPPPVSFRRRHSYSSNSGSNGGSGNKMKKTPNFFRTRLGSFNGFTEQHEMQQPFSNFKKANVSNPPPMRRFSFGGQVSPTGSSSKPFKSNFEFANPGAPAKVSVESVKGGAKLSVSRVDEPEMMASDEEALSHDGAGRMDENDDATFGRNTNTAYSSTTNGAPKTTYSYTSVDVDEYSPKFSAGHPLADTRMAPPMGGAGAPNYYQSPGPYYYLVPTKEMGSYMGNPMSPAVHNPAMVGVSGNNGGVQGVGAPPATGYYYTYAPYDPNSNPSLYPCYMYYNPNPIPGTPTEQNSGYAGDSYEQNF
ncbi:hypothetical protein OGAPHI_002677 [Ogataea philodendri]|uniref:RRM domain-containing protein n=1 Tax=Ogataea philodendri TaxID=1378263 RepID=A0A9P8PCS9_9ASCO|nr:uncharacterized protein OGAPHI_002677 [Ogataea philodendri]KAH3668922.1 hypothetical protein OGAPHI_002677 [Ogataea philodendri]